MRERSEYKERNEREREREVRERKMMGVSR